MDEKQDLSIFDKFAFERRPIGVKYSFEKPDGIQRLDRGVALCEMIKEAQLADKAFYVSREDQTCNPGAGIWPGNALDAYESGLFGSEMKIFKEPRANVRLKQIVPTLNSKTVRYISFAPVDKLTFTPDLLIILTNSSEQAEIILRAMTYATGEGWTSRTTCVMGCAWMLAYPYLTGNVNYLITGFGTGMKAKKLFPEGRQLISIPYDWISRITASLAEMPWVLPVLSADDVGGFVKDIESRLERLS